MKIVLRSALAAGLAAACCFAPLQASAGLFDDDEARRAILDIRARLDSLDRRMETKADKTTSLDLAGQSDQLRSEIARLRGQIEVLTNELSNAERRQKDFYTDLDGRIRKVEPQRGVIDGREVDIQPNEQKTYDAALALFKAGDYKNASAAFASFIRTYPQSGNLPSANYWLGNTYYAQRDYKNAIAAHLTVATSFPDNAKAPESLLNIASCYVELKDKPAAKKTLESLVSRYPDADAAKTARDRMASLK
ncbi:MAG: tol-pal system protein YbgF [Janthinobacterium lividum]